MEKINLNEYLASNEYPGRGIAVQCTGRTADVYRLLYHGPQREQPQPRV